MPEQAVPTGVVTHCGVSQTLVWTRPQTSPLLQPPQSIRLPQPSATWPHLPPEQAVVESVGVQAGLPQTLGLPPPPHHSPEGHGPLFAPELQSTVSPQPSAKMPHLPGHKVVAVSAVQPPVAPEPHCPATPPPPQVSPLVQAKPDVSQSMVDEQPSVTMPQGPEQAVAELKGTQAGGLSQTLGDEMPQICPPVQPPVSASQSIVPPQPFEITPQSAFTAAQSAI